MLDNRRHGRPRTAGNQEPTCSWERSTRPWSQKWDNRHPNEDELVQRMDSPVQPEQEEDPKTLRNVDDNQSRGQDGDGSLKSGHSTHSEAVGAKNTSNVKRNSSRSKSKKLSGKSSVTLSWKRRILLGAF